MRLRARSALEQLAGGERDLARLAADLGFADQSHLCRVIRRETGHRLLRCAISSRKDAPHPGPYPREPINPIRRSWPSYDPRANAPISSARRAG